MKYKALSKNLWAKNIGLKKPAVILSAFFLVFGNMSLVFAEDMAPLPIEPSPQISSNTPSVLPVSPEPITNEPALLDNGVNLNVPNPEPINPQGLPVVNNQKITSEEMSIVEPESVVQPASAGSTSVLIDPKQYSKTIEPKVDELTGNLTYEYPIGTPPGRNGIEPNLKIVYNSGDKQNDTNFGNGWSTNIPYIQRYSRGGTQDIYIAELYISSLFGELTMINSTTFVPTIKTDSYTTLTHSTSDDWTFSDKNGVKYSFGTTASSRQDDPNDSTHTYKYMLDRVEDLNGNVMTYEYTKDGGQIYPSKILYTASSKSVTPAKFFVEFSTASRSDVVTKYNTAFAVTNNYLISKIITRQDTATVSTYDFAYTTGDNGVKSLLGSVTNTGYDSAGTATALPPTTFTYTTNVRSTVPVDSNGVPTLGFALEHSVDSEIQTGNCTIGSNITIPCGAQFADINGDGLPDYIASAADLNSYGTATYNYNERTRIYFNTGTDFVDSGWELPTRSMGSINLKMINTSKTHITMYDQGNGGSGTWVVHNNVRFVDMNGDGKADILFQEQGGTFADRVCANQNQWEFYLNNGSGWTASSIYTPTVSVYYNIYKTSCSVNLSPSITQFVDLNNDGYLDTYVGVDTVYATNGLHQHVFINDRTGSTYAASYWKFDNSSTTIEWPAIFQSDDYINSRGMTKFADINDDGLPDLIVAIRTPGKEDGSGIPNTPPKNKVDVGEWQYTYINTGTGFKLDPNIVFPINDITFYKTQLTYPTVHKSHVVFSNYDENSGVPLVNHINNFFDFNGDGQPDLLDGNSFYISKNGKEWALSSYYSDMFSNYISTKSTYGRIPSSYVDSDRWVEILDLNADGLPDIFGDNFAYGGGPNIPMTGKGEYLSQSVVADLLSTITLPTGGSITATYQSSSLYKDANDKIINPLLPYQIPTVKKLETNDGQGHTSTTNYVYQGGEYYFTDIEHKKFAGFGTITKTDDSNITKTYYHQGDTTNTVLGEYDDHISKIGKPYRVEVYDLNNNLLDTTINKWDHYNIGTDHDFVYLARTSHLVGDASSHRDTTEEYTYDTSAGNLSSKKSDGEVVAHTESGDIISDIGIDDVTTTYAYTSGSFIKLTDEQTVDHNNNFMSETKHSYDSTGNEIATDNYLDANNFVETTTNYDTYGMPTDTTDPNGNITNFSYDTPHLYVAIRGDAMGYDTYYQYNYAIGQVTKVTDPNNNFSEKLYDGIGRPIEEKLNGATTEKYIYTDTANAFVIQKTDYRSTTDFTDHYTYLDGLGRTIQNKTDDGDGTFTTLDTVYNNRNLIDKSSYPYFDGSKSFTAPTTTTTLYSNYTYDALNRPLTITMPTGTTTYTYNLWDTSVTDANSHIKDLKKDAYGRLIEVDEHLAGTTYPTQYQYDNNGNLIQITDAMGNIRNFTYDALGHRLTATDLHNPSDSIYRIHRYTYDNNGNLIEENSQSGIANIQYSYDHLNRMTLENYGMTNTVYTYDSGTNGIGHLTNAKSGTIETAYSYDNNGRMASETKKLNGINYATSYLYDNLGNVISVLYPDGGKTNTVYSPFNLVNTITYIDPSHVSHDIVTNMTYSPNSRPLTMSNANGLTTINTYDDTKGYRLTDHKLQNVATSAILTSRSYSYDNVGNILTITDPNKTTTYTYDDLDRLLSATAVDTNNTTLWSQNYSYDILGNILNNAGTAYEYKGNLGTNYANPDAVTKIGTQNITYDKNGNLLTDGVHTNTWDYKNELTKTVQAGKNFLYAYDHTGQRVKYQTPTTTTWYPNPNYYTDGTTKTTDLYAGDTLVATITNPLAPLSGGTISVHYNDVDQVKSSSFGTDSTGVQEQVIEYYPYGAIASNTKAGSFDAKKKFGGHLHDDSTSYDYFGARYYEATKGRFISEDNVFLAIGDPNKVKLYGTTQEKVLIDPQNLNSYSYVENNPISHIDKDGNCIEDLCIGEATVLAGMVASYAPQITSFAQSLLTPIGQVGLSQIGEDTKQGNYGMAVIGALTAGEIPRGKTINFITKYGEDIGSKMNIVIQGANKTGLNFSEHSIQRMAEKNITPEEVLRIIKNNNPIEYFHEGSLKNGFRDPVSKIFVGQAKNSSRITTVINNTSSKYPSNLISKGKDALSKLKK